MCLSEPIHLVSNVFDVFKVFIKMLVIHAIGKLFKALIHILAYFNINITYIHLLWVKVKAKFGPQFSVFL